ncbi:hypothetical protein HK100_010008, partial [Physocladia obscura]
MTTSSNPRLLPTGTSVIGTPNTTSGYAAITTITPVCFHCKTKYSPMWRRTADGRKFLCNACGLYLRKHGVKRPRVVVESVKPQLPLFIMQPPQPPQLLSASTLPVSFDFDFQNGGGMDSRGGYGRGGGGLEKNKSAAASVCFSFEEEEDRETVDQGRVLADQARKCYPNIWEAIGVSGFQETSRRSNSNCSQFDHADNILEDLIGVPVGPD